MTSLRDVYGSFGFGPGPRDLSPDHDRDPQYSQPIVPLRNSVPKQTDPPKSLFSKIWYPLEGFGFLLLSGACFGLGNGLETISPLAWLHTFFLLVKHWHWLMVSGISVITQGLGVLLGFSSVFHYNNSLNESVGYAFGFGLGIWAVVTLVALLPHHFFGLRFPSSLLIPFIYPTAFTAVLHVVIGQTLSTLPSLATAVVDYAPMRQVAAILGAAGITFFTALGGSMAAFAYLRRKIEYSNNIIWSTLAFYTILMIITSYLIQADNIYQKNVSSLLRQSLNVSCIFAQSQPLDSTYEQQIWESTRSRVLAGDQFVIWSETAIEIKNSEGLELILNKSKSILSESKSFSYLGITYLRTYDDYQTNNFILLNPEGEIAWTYQKANPVPIIESHVKPGKPELPTYDSPYGKLGGAICFDLDYPQFIRQASAAKVDILIQPSWTWGAIDNRHFEGNALRAIENGFTLFRYSSDGVSGVISPRGVVWSRQYTGHDPSLAVTFNLPLWPRVTTLFALCGFVFEWVCLSVTGILLLFIYLPEGIVKRFLRRFQLLFLIISPDAAMDDSQSRFDKDHQLDELRNRRDSNQDEYEGSL